MSTREQDDEVTELTGDEGGKWRVVTRDSVHILDLDAGTATRIPGPLAPPTVNDRSRPLRTLEECRVGSRGYWTMHTDGWSDFVDFFYNDTSVIQRIERIGADEDPIGNEHL